MTLFVVSTDKCKESASTHNLTEKLVDFAERVERAQSTSYFQRFPSPLLVKKQFGAVQYRLIAEERAVGEDVALILLDILSRGDRATDQFIRDPREYWEKHLSKSYSIEWIDQIVKDRLKGAAVPTKPGVGNVEYGFLYEAFSHHNDSSDDLVCETQEWMDHVGTERVANQLSRLATTCLNAISSSRGLNKLPVEGKSEWSIVFYRLEGYLLLIGVKTGDNANEVDELAEATRRKLEGEDTPNLREAVLKLSRRAYPALILADDEAWIEMERDPLANRALSPEETEVLRSAREPQNPFPLFINGRAGSGKSTILQYLFADLLYYYLTNRDTQALNPPIYLTAIEELLRIASDLVGRLLRRGARFRSRASLSEEQMNDVLGRAFRQFQKHVLSLVSREDRHNRFPEGKRVDYSRFTKRWQEQFGNEPQAWREFGPDISWHVIRSYIKGLSADDYLEPEEYTLLPENQKTVSRKTFETVFKRVWEGWYMIASRDEGLWDYQDLARYVLKGDLIQEANQYPAVFCDEAQDFTRLELEVLLRSNLFSNRTLTPEEVRRVPFAFAGDQFQTLNPTGFRWDATKAYFVEKFIWELSPRPRQASVDLNYRELRYNYRSTQPIVYFSNHVQALREAMFQMQEIQPQIPWTSAHNYAEVVWFRAGDGNFWKTFRDEQGYVVIVPCNENEEQDFVLSDVFLRDHIARTEEDNLPVNVLSPVRAKGCEYPAVVVYGFGAACDEKMKKILDPQLLGEELDSDTSLPAQYFMNRLYVAVSRAKRRLIIVDTDEGLNTLWRYARDEAIHNTMIEKIRRGEKIWGERTGGMIMGTPDNLAGEAASTPLENAKAFEADGRARRDSFLIKQAAQAYKAAGQTPEYRECRALALELDNSLLEAGKAYLEAGFEEKAVECLWRAEEDGWKVLVSLVPDHPTIDRRLEVSWARFLLEKRKPSEGLDILHQYVRWLEADVSNEQESSWPVWNKALMKLLTTFSGPLGRTLTTDQWCELATILDTLRRGYMSIPPQLAANVYFRAGRFSDAIVMWDRWPDTNKPREYHEAKAAIEEYPAKLDSLARLKDSSLNKAKERQQIIEAYRGNTDIRLSSERGEIVVTAFLEESEFDEALRVSTAYCSATQTFGIALHAFRNGKRSLAEKALYEGIIALTMQREWHEVGRLLSSGLFVPTGDDWTESREKEWLRRLADRERVQEVWVKALARSQGLAEAPKPVLQEVSDFLRSYLRVRDGRWKRRVKIAEAGMAFEKAGRFVDAIAFYEAVYTDSASRSEEKEFARIRWIRCKKRQYDHEESMGARDRAARIMDNIDKALAHEGIDSIDKIPEYEDLPPIELPLSRPTPIRPSIDPQAPEPPKSEALRPVRHEPDPQKVSQIPVTVGPISIRISWEQRRCNLEHRETMETATIRLKDKKCEGDPDFRSTGNNHWKSARWGLSVAFDNDRENAFVLSFEEPGIKLILSPP